MQTLDALGGGNVRPVSRCSYSLDHVRSLLSTTIVQACGTHYLLERQVRSSDESIVSFCFRSIETGLSVFSFVPLRTPALAVLPEEVQHDMTISNGYILLVYYSKSGLVYGVQMVDENNLAALQAPLVCKFFSAGNTSKGTTDFTRRAEPDGTKERVTFPAPVVHEPLLKQLDGTGVSHLAAWRPTELVSAETARIRTMCSRLINAPLWVPPSEYSSVLLRCRPPYIVMVGEDLHMWKLEPAREGLPTSASCIATFAGRGRNVVAVNWTSSQLVLAESDGTTEAGSFFTIMPLPMVGATAIPVASALVVRSQFPIQPNYLDLFSTDAKTLIFASMKSTLGSVCAKCPMYNTFCVDVPNSPCAPTLQFQMHADACTGAPSTPTPTHTQADAAAHGHTKHAIFRPQGILYGSRGPFLVCSNGHDALWYHFSPHTEADTRSESESLPYTTTILRLADVPAKHGKPSQGCRKVFFAGTKLVDLWTDFHDKQRTLTVMEPTRKLIDTMGLNGELHSLAHCDCIHGRLPSVGQAH